MATINEYHPLARLRHHVTGAIERGQAVPIVEAPAPHVLEASHPGTMAAEVSS